MTQMIWLAPGVARCIGGNCDHPRPCALRLAGYEIGRPLGDYSQPSNIGPAACCGPKWTHYKHPSEAIRPTPDKVVKPYPSYSLRSES